MLEIHIIPGEGKSLAFPQAGAQKKERKESEGSIRVVADQLHNVIARSGSFPFFQPLREPDGGHRVILGIASAYGVVKDHPVDGSDGVHHGHAVAVGLGCCQVVGHIQCTNLCNRLVTVAG